MIFRAGSVSDDFTANLVADASGSENHHFNPFKWALPTAHM